MNLLEGTLRPQSNVHTSESAHSRNCRRTDFFEHATTSNGLLTTIHPLFFRRQT